ncbi:fibronectin type III domain-containing protein [Bacillus sp. SD088]|nr:fibronectin type III domain-containing protein [Bacillus sp. SD088]
MLSVVLCLAIFPPYDHSAKADNSKLPAFPGAEGFGYASVGGRGGEVYHVTSRELTGPGTFHDALMTAGDVPRTIVFDISGEITIPKTVVNNKSNITIAGQTAPGDGITIRGNTLRFINSQDIIIRFVRFRMGAQEDFNDDAMYIEDSQNVIIDHCTFSWATDEVLSIKSKNYEDPKSKNITVQWSIMSEGLLTHSMGGLIEMNTITMHHNVYAHNNDRNPKTKGQIDFVNNIVYNWGQYPYVAGGESGTKGYGNVVGNYFIAGLNSKDPEYAIVRGNENYQVFLENNRLDHNQNGILDGKDTGTDMIEAERPSVVVPERFEYPLVHTQEPEEAYEYVLDYSGASLTRDDVDKRVIDSVRDQTGVIIGHETDVGGYPALQQGTLPLDSDGDGMPDEWEIKNGLDPNDPEDRNGDMHGEGYTNLEYYLNELAAPSFPKDYPTSPPEWEGPPFIPPTDPDPEEPVKEPVVGMDGEWIRNAIINDNSKNGIENAKKWSIEKNLQVGDFVAGDRMTGNSVYRFTSIPDELIGMEWIRSAVDSRSASNDDLLSFHVVADTDVYVAHDSRIGTLPEWLASYEDTGKLIEDDQPVKYKLYKKHYPAGSFVVTGSNNNTSRMNYFMALKPNSEGQPPESAPTELEGEVLGDASVNLKWLPVNDADTYLIYRSSSVNQLKAVATSKTAEYVDDDLELGHTYYYKVSALNASGESPHSNELELAAYDSSVPVPVAPKGLEVIKARSMSIQLKWEALEDVTGYSIYRANEKEGSYKKVASATKPEYTDGNLTPDTKYYYKVSATGVGGESEKTNNISTKTGPPVVLPEIPVGLTTGKITTSTFELLWEAVDGAESYNIYRKANEDNNFSLIENITSTHYMDNSVDNNRSGYTYKITALNEIGETNPSKELVIDMPLPQAPTELKVGLVGESFVGLIWTSGGGGNQFNIYREANGRVENVGYAKVETFYDRTVEPGGEYVYYLKAENASGESKISNKVKITPDQVATASMKTFIEQFKETGEWTDEKSAHALNLHLTAVEAYEKQDKKEKVVKHMENFKQLAKIQKDDQVLPIHLYNILKSYTNAMIGKWKGE